MGYGTVTEDGAKNSVTDNGSVTAQELTLIAKSATSEYIKQKYDEYDLTNYGQRYSVGNLCLEE